MSARGKERAFSSESLGVLAALVLILRIACFINLHELAHFRLVPRRDLPIDRVRCIVHRYMRIVQAACRIHRVATVPDSNLLILHASWSRPLTDCVIDDAEVANDAPRLNLAVDVFLLKEVVVLGNCHFRSRTLTHDVVVVLTALLDHLWILVHIIVFVVEDLWARGNRRRLPDLT